MDLRKGRDARASPRGRTRWPSDRPRMRLWPRAQRTTRPSRTHDPAWAQRCSLTMTMTDPVRLYLFRLALPDLFRMHLCFIHTNRQRPSPQFIARPHGLVRSSHLPFIVAIFSTPLFFDVKCQHTRHASPFSLSLLQSTSQPIFHFWLLLSTATKTRIKMTFQQYLRKHARIHSCVVLSMYLFP